MNRSELIRAAQQAQSNAHATYSNFKVGAALRSTSGQVFQGCNVENASYGLTICAERTALFSAIAAGERSFSELVVVTEPGVTPCGACRQVIWELCGDIAIIMVDSKGNQRETSSAALLPEAFDSKDLAR
jgi:cytidine deaminase